MKISYERLEVELARQCKTISDLREGASPKTLMKIRMGQEVTPRTVGRIARALAVDVSEILEVRNECQT